MQGIHTAKWEKLFKALGSNSQVTKVSLANCGITDSVGAMIADCLRSNDSIRLLILDSNNIIGATSQTRSVEELKVSNQVCW